MKNFVLIADCFPPLTNSGAIQVRDLALEFVKKDFSLTVITPDPNLSQSFLLEDNEGIQVVRLRSSKLKNISYFRRTINEFLLPFKMIVNIRKSRLIYDNWDGIIWYSPTIFLGLFVHYLKSKNSCKSYLIIRDIFPQWAHEMGILSKSPLYYFFNFVARYQYSQADTIGIQTSGNEIYFQKWKEKNNRRLEVLSNWLGDSNTIKCSLRIDDTILKDRVIFLYAGNMGVAQDLDIVLELAFKFRFNPNIGFLFVGGGREYKRLEEKSIHMGLLNVIFHKGVHPDEIEDLYSQCDIGIVSLDKRHKSHNIPGKFISYMKFGLPVLAIVNQNNDLVNLINSKNVGVVTETHDVNDLFQQANKLLEIIDSSDRVNKNCKSLFLSDFSVEKAMSQIINSLAT